VFNNQYDEHTPMFAEQAAVKPAPPPSPTEEKKP
jgi:hypothetical protein